MVNTRSGGKEGGGLPADNTLPLHNMRRIALFVFHFDRPKFAAAALIASLLAVAPAGCSQKTAPQLSIGAAPDQPPASAVTGDTSPSQAAKPSLFPQTEAPAAALTPQGNPKEWWEAVYVNGVKIGWGHMAQTDIDEDGQKLVRIEMQNHLAIDRDRQRTNIDITTTSVETPDGQLLRFGTDMTTGTSRTQMNGRIAEGKLTIETTTAGKTISDAVPCPAGILGFSATDQSFGRSPMLPGQQRKLQALMPATNEVVTIDLAADKYAPTPLLDHTEDLLRIECTLTLPINSPDGKPPIVRSLMWTNHEGQVLKTSIAALHQETFRTTRELAMADGGQRRIDLVVDNTVPVAKAIVNPHETKLVRYRVWLQADDPAKVFFTGPLQSVRSLDDHTAEITVRQLSPASAEQALALEPAVPTRLPTEKDRQPNSLIQSDDEAVVAMANSVAPDERDSTKLAVALEKFVHDTIKLKDFSQAFATAAEVARTPEGDCTEHAVLLAALARARGIPARVAIGLVYQPSTQSFGYHMWNELWIGDRWVPLDATLGRGGIGAAHLMLTDSDLAVRKLTVAFCPWHKSSGN